MPPSLPVLLVEDKDSLRTMLRHALEAQGHAVVEARDEQEAIQEMRQARPAVVLTDLKLPKGDGFGVLRAAKELDPDLQVVVMTAYGSIQDAVSAMKEGAMEFLAKPVDPDHLSLMVARALAHRRVLTENMMMREELAEKRGAPRIIGEDPALRAVLQQLHRAAATDATVLLEGESGTGKELFARALHTHSPRQDGPFIAINCAAIPETLLETELFGHEKGAFTGASARKPGRFEMAHRGTLFLDEIGDLPLTLQAKILRALEEKRFERVGGTQSLQVDVRVVAATNRNLKARVADRQFREDLYFRLSVFPVQIPPLRERTDDVLRLARHFVERICRDVNKKTLMLSEAAVEELCSYSWPGNVRELQNCIERAVILTEGDTIQPRHLSLSFRQPGPPLTPGMMNGAAAPTLAVGAPAQAGGASSSPWDQIDLSGTMSEALRRIGTEVERRKIEQALKDARGSRMAAADALQLGFKALGTRMRQLGIPEPPQS
jgi:DNA-binding NtrC family response regulator